MRQNTSTSADRTAGELANTEPDVVVVLHRTRDLVNIAGSVRAMMNTGLSRLRLVRPVEFDAWRVSGIAHGASNLLAAAEHFDDLDEALADTVHVAGTTARRRTSAFHWQHPREAAPELLGLATARRGPVALLFGPEDAGLTNAELDRCDRLLNIPTDPRHPSLNLAQAVLIVSYELWLAREAAHALPRHRKSAPPATHAELDALFRDAETTIQTLDFFKTRNPPAIMRTLRAAARRAGLDSREAKLLRAIAIEARKRVSRSEDAER